jgi:hypothetical protein
MARIPRRLVVLSATGVVAVAAAGSLAVIASATPTSSLPKLTIALNGTTTTVAGPLQSGGVNIVTTTTTESHGNPILIRLNPGVTPAQIYALFSSPTTDPNQIDAYGSIVFNAQTTNHGVSEVQTTLAPGQYVATDGNGSGPDATAFTITAAATPAVLPTPGGTISTIDFAIRGAGVLHDGELVRFINRGFVIHMVATKRTPSLAAARQALKLLVAGKKVPASLTVGQGVQFDGGLSPGAYQQMTITQHPGIWIVTCFMNTQDGREHAQLGMVRIIRILK